jgi:AraC family transcriptional regulator of adaptative response/methylated-DNA-[protein]-cysteine methyltransferase
MTPSAHAADSDYQRVEAALAYLAAAAARAQKPPPLAEVAAHLGLSPAHFQRLFVRWAGISPMRLWQYATLQRARRALSENQGLLHAAHAVGLSGPGRLHDLFLTWEAMTPGEFKAASVAIQWAVHPTPLGPAVFAATPRGLCGLEFLGPKETTEQARGRVAVRWPHSALREDPRATRPYAQSLAERFAGRGRRPLALLLGGTLLQLKVWEALLRVPAGAVVTYGALAQAVDLPGGARAVGGAVGKNPIGYLIPCHRVIQSQGALGGYRWGPDRKRALLGVEWARSADAGTGND